MRCQQIFLTVMLLVCGVPFFVNGGELEESSFILSASDQQAKIWIFHEEPKFVRLAVMDLMADVKKITGRDLDLVLNLEAEWARKHLSAQALPQLQSDEYHMKVIAQRIGLANAMQLTEMLGSQLSKSEYEFFQTDLQSNVLLMSGLTKWLDHILRARQAIDSEDKILALSHLGLAQGWFEEVNIARLLKNQGKWENWYVGDKKVNLPNSLKITEETLDQMKSSVR